MTVSYLLIVIYSDGTSITDSTYSDGKSFTKSSYIDSKLFSDSIYSDGKLFILSECYSKLLHLHLYKG